MIHNPNTRGFSILYPLDLVATILSLLGSLVMCWMCLRLPSEKKTVSVKFILALAVSDFLYSIANFMSLLEKETTPALCTIEATIRQSSFLACIFYSACIAFVSYKSSFSRVHFNSNQFFIKMMILGPLICTFISIGMPRLFAKYFIFSDFGTLNCSIVIDASHGKLIALLFYMGYRGIPVLLGLMIVIISYFKALKQVSQLPSLLIKRMNYQPHKLLVYPIVLLLIFMPSLVDQILQIYDENRPLWITIMRVGITHSIGFINALVYVLLRDLYQPSFQIKNDDLEEPFSTSQDGGYIGFSDSEEPPSSLLIDDTRSPIYCK